MPGLCAGYKNRATIPAIAPVTHSSRMEQWQWSHKKPQRECMKTVVHRMYTRGTMAHELSVYTPTPLLTQNGTN